ncbi:glycosyltransferase [Planomonospora sp. ID82291]|uniref:glycosyltransferase n=1 Tax=Planomonospora sp. ID82291 TaxID=2738136 RepID=UPI0018C3C42E|nr:glycosyltransferase [Planomonospora sp. ID82291]MBG0813044.1 glycosyltransferase [Planomonospora sp. ID82291]
MTGGAAIGLPPIRHNDYSPLKPPGLGGWEPSLPVSVVIPARGGQHRLDLVLAALAAQSYPGHLMEVIVVDDGSEPPLRLPEIAPADTRIVPADPGRWGIAHAVNSGAARADGRVLQRLDSDMVVCREHIEALARWHHLSDHVVAIGAKTFIEEPPATPARVHEAVRTGSLEDVFDLSAALPSSTEKTIARLDGLRASRNPYHVCTGPTVSMRREVFQAVGGLDPAVPRGEDTEFAYRLAQHGVVFVPDMAARAVHLGLPAQRLDRDRAVRLVAPYLAHRIPLRRDLRGDRGRRWLVPYVEVVLHVDGAAEERVREAVGAALSGSVGDVAVALVAPWPEPDGGRRPEPDDPDADLRLMREHFAHDERVRTVTGVSPTPAPVPFRYTGPVAVPPGPRTLEKMIDALQRDRLGMLTVDLGADGTAVLERTEALGRALLLGARDPDAVAASVRATHGVRRGGRAEFWPAARTDPAGTGSPARAPESAPPSAETRAEPARVRNGAPGTDPGGRRPGPAGRASTDPPARRPQGLFSRLRAAIGQD